MSTNENGGDPTKVYGYDLRQHRAVVCFGVILGIFCLVLGLGGFIGSLNWFEPAIPLATSLAYLAVMILFFGVFMVGGVWLSVYSLFLYYPKVQRRFIVTDSALVCEAPRGSVSIPWDSIASVEGTRPRGGTRDAGPRTGFRVSDPCKIRHAEGELLIGRYVIGREELIAEILRHTPSLKTGQQPPDES
jgi:hypothetical protein